MAATTLATHVATIGASWHPAYLESGGTSKHPAGGCAEALALRWGRNGAKRGHGHFRRRRATLSRSTGRLGAEGYDVSVPAAISKWQNVQAAAAKLELELLWTEILVGKNAAELLPAGPAATHLSATTPRAGLISQWDAASALTGSLHRPARRAATGA